MGVRRQNEGVFRALLLIAILLSLAGCRAKVATQPEPGLRLAVDTTDPILQLPIFVAARERLFESQHLRLTLDEFPNAAKATEALTGGTCQLASSGFEQVLEAGTKGQTLTAFALLSRSPMLNLIASVHRKRRQPPGRLNSVATVSAGDATDLFGRYVAHAETQPQGSMAEVVAALEKRKVEAAVLDAPTLHLLEARGGAYELLADTRTLAGLIEVYGVSTYPGACVYANGTWLADHKDQNRRIAKALSEAFDWIRKHKAEELLPMLPDSYRKTMDEAVLLTVIGEARPLFSQDGTIPAEAAEAVRKVLAASGEAYWKSPVPASAFTNEYVAAGPGR
jgi:ABC-type nitrate/sulfonate/bicarbonate transport system substrate-binding protein